MFLVRRYFRNLDKSNEENSKNFFFWGVDFLGLDGEIGRNLSFMFDV